MESVVSDSKPVSTALWAIFSCLLWSTAFVGVKAGLQYAKPLSFAGVRFMISGLLIVPFCKPSQYVRQVRVHMRLILMVGLFQTALLYGFFYIGMTMVSGAMGAIVIGSSPLFAALVAHFVMHDDRMNIRKTGSILLGILGIVIVTLSRQPWSSSGFQEGIGVVFLIMGCLSSAFGNVIFTKNRYNVHPLIFNSAQIFYGGFLLLLVSLPVEGLPRWQWSGVLTAALAWLSVLSAAAFSIWFAMLKRPGVKVSELNVWKFVIPLFGAMFSWIFLKGESPTWPMLGGMLFVTVSILAFYRSTRLKSYGTTR